MQHLPKLDRCGSYNGNQYHARGHCRGDLWPPCDFCPDGVLCNNARGARKRVPYSWWTIPLDVDLEPQRGVSGFGKAPSVEWLVRMMERLTISRAMYAAHSIS